MDHKQSTPETETETVEDVPQQAETEDTTSPVAASHIVAPKKRSRVLWFVLGGIVLLALFAAIAYLLVARPWQQQAKSTDTTTSSVTAVDLSTAQTVVNEAKKNLAGAVLSATKLDGSGAIAADGTPAYALPLQQVTGNDFAAVPATGVGIGYSSSAAVASSNYQAFEKFFADNHFSLKTTNKQISPLFVSVSVSSVNYAVYVSDSVACAIWHADASKIVADRHVSGLGCANKSDYESVASNLKVLAAAYKQSSDGKDSVTIGMPTDYSASGYDGVAVPQVDGVQLASEGSAATTKAYYYKQSSAKDWKFVGKSDGVPACTLFSDDTLKQLFKDVKCS